MKRFFTPRVRTVLIIAIVLALVLAISSSVTGKNVSGSLVQGLLTPLRTGVSELKDQAE